MRTRTGSARSARGPRVSDVLEEFEDGRLNIVVEGGERFRVHELTRGRSFMTATVEPLEDEAERGLGGDRRPRGRRVPRAGGARRRGDRGSGRALAAALVRARGARRARPRGEAAALDSVSEQERLELVVELLDEARQTLIATRELGERAKRNGSRLS